MNLVKQLFSLNGRVGRGMLWISVLIWVVAIAVAAGGTAMIASLDAALSVGLLVVIVAFASAIAVGIKRLHDRNKTPLWLLLFYGVPVVLYLILPRAAGTDQAGQPFGVIVLQYVWLVVTLWALIELGLVRGTIGPNPHGPDPVAPKPAPARPAH